MNLNFENGPNASKPGPAFGLTAEQKIRRKWAAAALMTPAYARQVALFAGPALR